jgi:hypothetical protein
MKCPGGANDVRAFQLSSLHNACANFPLGIYLVGDNAYIPTEGMLTQASYLQQICRPYSRCKPGLSVEAFTTMGILGHVVSE